MNRNGPETSDRIIIMKVIPILLSLWIVISGTVTAEQSWHTEVKAALSASAQSGKPVLAKFTGSDWCIACIKLDMDIFSKPAFVKEASKHYELLIVDEPMRNKEVSLRNRPYFKKYGVKSVPAVLLLKSNGKEYYRCNPKETPTVKGLLSQISPANVKQVLQGGE